MYDEMIDDIFEQKEKKNRKSLQDIPKYNLTDEQEDDFDIAYRTPKDISVKDLIPKKYIELSEQEMSQIAIGADAFYDKETDNIYITKGQPDSIKIHEHMHKKQANQNVFPLSRTNNTIKRDSSFDSQMDKDIMKLAIKSKKQDPFFTPANILYPAGYEYTTNEPIARFAEHFPKEIINPTTKTGKRLNRIWFE